MGAFEQPSRTTRPWISLVALSLLSGCATAPITRDGSVSSYQGLAPSNGIFTKSMVKANRAELLAAKTIRIVPTVFSYRSGASALSERQRRLVANAVDRSMCFGLSERYKVVTLTERADLTVHAVITHLEPTQPLLAGASKVASFAPRILLPDVPIPVPRIPIGLGSLSVEAEARDQSGKQRAAMLWARGANPFIGKTRVAKNGDAYELASNFADDFSKLLITGDSTSRLFSLPSVQSIKTSLGARPKYPACEAFGRSPGIQGLVGGIIGLPPGWTDRSMLSGTSSD